MALIDEQAFQKQIARLKQRIAELEEQLCTCEFEDQNEENDRLDAAAYAVLELANIATPRITLL